MLPNVIDLVCFLVSGILGALAASWLWYSHSCRQAAIAVRFGLPAADAGSHSPPAAGGGDRLQKVATQMAVDFAVRLHELATQVAFDVGEHKSQVQAINKELTASNAQDSAKVLDVVVKLLAANQQMQEKLTKTEQKLQEQSDRMQSLLAETRTDALTLLTNRRAFDDELAKRFAEFHRQGRTFSLTVADVDHLKKFNDTYGHRAGDNVLRSVAKALRRTMRETDIVARYGGDEFAIIHADADLAEACELAEQACRAIENHPFVHDGKNLGVSVSLGVAELLDDEDAAETLKRADAAMYASKKVGRNCVHFHDGMVLRRLGANEEQVPPPGDLPQPGQPAASHCKEDKNARLAPEGEGGSRSVGAALPETPLELSGRTHFCQQVRTRMAEWKRGGPAFSVALIGVSQCDESGTQNHRRALDVALRVTNRCLLATTRDMDVLGSYTPGCFALMMPTAGLTEAIRVATRILEDLSEFISLASAEQSLCTLSVGVVQAVDADDATSILKRAEMALDAAERGRGNPIYCHDGQRVVPSTAILKSDTALYSLA